MHFPLVPLGNFSDKRRVIGRTSELLAKVQPQLRLVVIYSFIKSSGISDPVGAIIPPGEKIKYTNVIEINYALGYLEFPSVSA